MRWLDTLQEYDIDIQYVPGKVNTVADSLSRIPVPATELYPVVDQFVQ